MAFATRSRRKTAGSNEGDRGRSRGRSRTRREQPKGRNQSSPPKRGYFNGINDESEDEVHSSKQLVLHTNRSVPHQAQPEAFCSRFINPADIPAVTGDEEEKDSSLSEYESPESANEWEDLSPQTPTANSPSYPFPGTWSAALQDSNKAMSKVGSATLSYATALATSGMGKATLSISAAALSTTNKYAASLTSWGLAKSGFGRNELPAPICKWLKKKEDADKKKNKARKKSEAVQREFTDERGRYVLDMHDTDAEGDFVRGAKVKATEVGEEAGWGEQEMKGGGPFDDRFAIADSDEESESEESNSEDEEDAGEGDGLVRIFEFDD
ncbi:hypothetical protein COCMIDRAFT_3663 [Bipolaris oryzae ATCC 44560]|uniref:Uncharacterized protein n=1 Tax=Bipolaris oryzae ATCC 44560 TaxID=930090 RepID=W6ZJ00_COCMI|nr:uncharacterized protein COCMIDRAFT_3663 [Bipolaris oryzae ATCC 44560]EUC47409.1 hypothetical protein COCMIDRAFT_3663 [Bipolaris oryzae ATCC 44560]